MCENLQSKDSSYFYTETTLLVKTTLWIIPMSYLLKSFTSSFYDYRQSMGSMTCFFSYGCYYIRLLKLTYCIRNVPIANLLEGLFTNMFHSSCEVHRRAFLFSHFGISPRPSCGNTNCKVRWAHLQLCQRSALLKFSFSVSEKLRRHHSDSACPSVCIFSSGK